MYNISEHLHVAERLISEAISGADWTEATCLLSITCYFTNPPPVINIG